MPQTLGKVARQRMITRLYDQGINNHELLDVMLKVPRHIFVDEAFSYLAYDDNSLPIGFRQTISKPYMVAKMTELSLKTLSKNKVLEIGTGCGYQTAILAHLFAEVVSIERIADLQNQAKANLNKLKLSNIDLINADGTFGYQSKAPFDAILVTAAATQIPVLLLKQLALDANLVIPLIGADNQQYLYWFRRTKQGIQRYKVEPVSFVPLITGE